MMLEKSAGMNFTFYSEETLRSSYDNLNFKLSLENQKALVRETLRVLRESQQSKHYRNLLS